MKYLPKALFSPESSAIFDFILELYHSYLGHDSLRKFLTYAATFLSNVENYFGSGDQKFIPDVRSPRLSELYDKISATISTRPPFALGYPSESSQKYEVLLASVQIQDSDDVQRSPLPKSKGVVRLAWDILTAYIESFQTGSLDTYRDSQRMQVRDKAPRVKNIFGFVEPYHNPHGVKSKFKGLVAIADDEETRLLTRLVENSAKFIRRLPWAAAKWNDKKGPFEKNLFEPPDFASIHTLAYCSSIIFPGINLPNYNDIRQEDGFKNVIISNRMIAESQAIQYSFIDSSENDQFRKHKFQAYYWWVVLHGLLGHGTGKMMIEFEKGKYNFEIENRPINPITRQPITSCSLADLSTTIDECKAELVSAYLMDDPKLLELFGFTENSDIRAKELTYNVYQQLGFDGLRGLSNFNADSGKWGHAHSRAHFSILKCLILDGDGVVTVIHDKGNQSLTVRVDQSKISSHGKPALGRMLLPLHIYRCTADTGPCRKYYEELSRVEGEYIEWRETVLANKLPPLVFAHANTFLDGDTVTLKEYEPTIEGIIKSWAERKV
ncbi:peptidase family M49-domain-containing protein [Biscogniauxia marginata]|nr:peptidase family M49-domain-containing protein [Biscogniauxia marginata]